MELTNTVEKKIKEHQYNTKAKQGKSDIRLQSFQLLPTRMEMN